MLTRLKKLLMSMLPKKVAGNLRAWRNRRFIREFTPRTVQHRYGSGTLTIQLADPLGQGWYDRDWSDLPEIAWLRRSRLKPGALVFDLGAHQAVVALMLSREVQPGGRVIALEATPHNADIAQRNCELNQAVNVTVISAAVSNESGRLVFSGGLNGQIDDGTGAAGQLEVAAVTIDELASRYGTPDVLFLDIEGAECRALQGASRTLRSQPDVFVEVHVGEGLEKLGGSVAEVFSFFPPEDFVLFGRAEGPDDFRPIALNDPITANRFFLIAQARASDACPSQ